MNQEFVSAFHVPSAMHFVAFANQRRRDAMHGGNIH